MKMLSIQYGKKLKFNHECKTLPQMLVRTAAKYPAKGIVYVNSYGDEDFVSYPELEKKARQYLTGMRKAGIMPGDKVIIEIDDPKEFFFTYWAALVGGIIPAPITQPTSYDPGSAGFLKMRKVYEILEKPVILVEDRKKEKYNKIKEDPYFRDLVVLSAEDLESGEMAEVYDPDPRDTAFLQFSSGSTGTPKGVVLTHANIIANLEAICSTMRFDSTEVICTWLPHTHDMGLIGQHLLAVAEGMMKVKLTPLGFIRSPLIFLKKVTKYKATMVCCPNFGINWMIERVRENKMDTLDLSSLKAFFNGAEPISAKVMNEFINKFMQAGFRPEIMYPVYGMAEATLAVAFPEYGSLPGVHSVSRGKLVNERTACLVPPDHDESDVVQIVDEGYAVDGIDIRIADPRGNVVEEKNIGEIQIRGPSVTSGYYNNEEVNRATFIDGWLKTGDLGFMHDGKLLVTGRMKDIIFVRGQNYYAHDIEEIIYKVDGIKRGTVAVVGAFNSQSQKEEIIAFIKNKGNMEKLLPLRHVILEIVNTELGIELTHVLPVKAIPKTTSGKLQRFSLVKDYENGEFNAVMAQIDETLAVTGEKTEPVVQPATELETAIRRAWAKVLMLKEEVISIDSNFFQLGGNSIKGIQLIAELEILVQYELDHDVLISCKTISEIAQYLAENKTTKKSVRDELIKLSENETKQHNRSHDLLHKIAVTGMALRLPSADNKDEFWENLVSQKKCIARVSEKRRKLCGEKDWNDWICELPDIDMFDNEFFGIPAENVKVMDPQQRIMMEVAYECLEDAGIAVKLDQEMNIGVYSGVSQNSYIELVRKVLNDKGVDAIAPGAMAGNMSNIIAAYISHLFNFTGPAISIDTACSSAGVSLSLGVNAIRSGQIKGALVMSSNLMITPTTHVLSQKAGILSQNDRCLVFDKNADGTILGEGVVVFYIEPLVNAIKEQKNIYGIIEGIGVNNDGYSLSIMAPNPKGQYEALVAAYKDAATNPVDVSYIEAHGTGTPLGDPVEIQALDKLFREFKNRHSCGIGSVKSNVGHLLPTAGAAGLAKTLLCMKHRKKVPTFFPRKSVPSPDVEKSPFYIVDKVEDWTPTGNKPLKAGISSFGFGGTNVHIVLGEYIGSKAGEDCCTDNGEHIITFSAHTPKSLEMNIRQTAAWLSKNRQIRTGDICYTRNNLRQHFQYRKAFVFRDMEDLLQHFYSSRKTAVEMAGVYHRTRTPRTALIMEDTYPGTRFSMDHALYLRQAGFREAFDECAEVVKEISYPSVDIREMCLREEADSTGNSTDMFSESGMNAVLDFSIKYSLARMWIGYGLIPSCVMGKGSGELAAMAITGRISITDGLIMACYRARVLTAGAEYEKYRERYLEYARKTEFREDRMPFLSFYDFNFEEDKGNNILYWIDTINTAPDFSGAVKKLKKLNCGLIANIGFGDEFINFIGGDYDLKEKVRIQKLMYSNETLVWKKILESIGQLYVRGFPPNWETIYPRADHRMVSLPSYCFDRKSFWLDVA